MMLLSLPMTSHEWHEQHQRWLYQLTVLNANAVGPLGLMNVFAGTVLLAALQSHALALGLTVFGMRDGLGYFLIFEGLLLIFNAGECQRTVRCASMTMRESSARSDRTTGYTSSNKRRG